MKNSHIVLLGTLLLGSVMLVTGCKAQLIAPAAMNGDTVQMQYTGKLKDGTVFDSSVGQQPLEFTLGGGQVIPGFDKAVLGMRVGESKTVTIPPEDAYGAHRDDLVKVVSLTEFEDLTPRVGQKLQEVSPNGSTVTVSITAVSETTVTVDANHPLAGKDLVFEIKLLSIK